MFSYLKQTRDLFGVIIVSQPTKISTIGLMRTIDLLRVKQIPIIGLVANQDGFLNRLGEIEYQFLSPRVDLKDIAQKAGIPFLMSIPQTGDNDKLKPYFSELADKVVSSKPVVLKDITMVKKLKRKVVKGIARRL
ncbi:Iron-sulfur cluster carrier protein [subsurface metagenome]